MVVAFEIADESDPGPYPIPPDAPVEGGSCATGDRHVIVVQEGTCLLYELFSATSQPDGSWQAYSGARFDLASNALRPESWTSADAAGMPILPGLVRYEEIDAGVIPHALRALVRVKAPDIDKVLLARLKDQDYGVREAVAGLVGEVKPAGGVSALTDAYQAALPDAAYGARAAAISALAEYGGPEAIEGIRAGLADKDWAVRVRAAELLGKLDPSGDHQQAIRPVPSAFSRSICWIALNR